MRSVINAFVSDDSTRGRALRSSAILIVGLGGSNLMRLLSNLVLTRLLFPEAFGLISLVYVFLTGLAMFSDIGLNVSIIQNKRGDDPVFLNTAWSLQIIRGGILWLGACALAYPAAAIYDEPQLALLLPIVGLTVFIQGFATTKIALANRNLQIGVQVATDLGSQVISLGVTVFFAWATGSVWSIAAGVVVGATIKVIAQHHILEGPASQWNLDRQSVKEIVKFGKYVFFGSMGGFLINQSDRAILGYFVSLTDLGVFTVAFMFATVPVELSRAAGGQIIFPLFSKFPPALNAENRAKVLKARRFVLLATAAMGGVLSIISVPMITYLYDSRYHDAGPMLALFGFAVTAQIAASNYDGSYLGSGDSKRHFYLIAIQAVIQLFVSLVLISNFGVFGAVTTLGATMLIAYPFRARAAHHYNAWDPKTDLMILAVGWGCALFALFIWQTDILASNAWK